MNIFLPSTGIVEINKSILGKTSQSEGHFGIKWKLTLYNDSCILAFNLACPVLSPDTKILSPCLPTRSISDMYAGGVYVDSENLRTLKGQKKKKSKAVGPKLLMSHD